MNLSSATPFTRRVSLRALVLGTAASLLLLSSFFALRAIAQEKGPAASPKQPAKLAHPAQSAPSEQQSKNKLTTALPQHDDAEQLRKREEWFYKQRADELLRRISSAPGVEAATITTPSSKAFIRIEGALPPPERGQPLVVPSEVW